jgi:hypothetical protein
MLPKVANQILHASSRAVAAAQYQSHTLRNVLQLQTSSGPSSSGTIWNGVGSSSSSWGNNGSGAGPGGPRFNSSSHYYSSYAVRMNIFFLVMIVTLIEKKILRS